MKKIFIILLMFPLLLKGQVIYNTSDNAYDDYHDYLENGNWRSAEVTEKNVLRTADLMLMMLWASAVGYSTDSISALLAKLNALSYHGETFTAPSFSYSITANLTLDSIKITGGAWTSYFHTTDSINSLIADGINTEATIKGYAKDTVDNAFFTELNVDTIKFDTDGNYYIGINSGGSLLTVRVNGATALDIIRGGGYKYLTSFNGLHFTGVSDPSIYTNGMVWFDSDDNVLYFRQGGKMIPMSNTFASGAQHTVQLSNGDSTFTSDADYTIQSDTAKFKHEVLSGTLRLAKWGTTDTSGLYKLPNGVVDTMEWVRSSWASHKENIEPFDVFFKKRDLADELNWPRWKDDDYHKINPMYANTQFSVAFERTWVYIEDLYEKNKKLENRINVLEGIIRKEYKLSKRQLKRLNK